MLRAYGCILIISLVRLYPVFVDQEVGQYHEQNA